MELCERFGQHYIIEKSFNKIGFGEGRGRHKIMHKKFSFESIAFDTSFKGRSSTSF